MVFRKKKIRASSVNSKKSIESDDYKENDGSGIIVLGSGCKKCNELERNVQKALENLNINEQINHITDFREIASYGVMSTPALVIDNEVVSYGRVLSESESIEILKKYRGK